MKKPLIGCGVIVLVLFVACSVQLAKMTPSTDAGSKPVARVANTCDIAHKRSQAATTAWNADRYQAAYDLAVSGLHYVEGCNDEDEALLNEAYLMTSKGLSEHYLSSGDSRTDLNQANTLLEECVTNPRFYGQHIGAQCETQMHTNISMQTNWDVGQ